MRLSSYARPARALEAREARETPSIVLRSPWGACQRGLAEKCPRLSQVQVPEAAGGWHVRNGVEGCQRGDEGVGESPRQREGARERAQRSASRRALRYPAPSISARAASDRQRSGSEVNAAASDEGRAVRSCRQAPAHRGRSLGKGAANASAPGAARRPRRRHPRPLSTAPQVAIKKMKRKFFSWDECLSLREVRGRRAVGASGATDQPAQAPHGRRRAGAVGGGSGGCNVLPQ